MSRLYEYYELGKQKPVQISSYEILKTYREHVEELAKKLGKPKPTDEDVIDEFVITFWAWEVEEEPDWDNVDEDEWERDLTPFEQAQLADFEDEERRTLRNY